MKSILGIIFICWLAVSNVYGQPVTQNDKEQFAKTFGSYIQGILKNVDIPAIGVTILSEGKPVFIKTYGLADKEAGIKADNNTLFYIASSTKSFTALAAALLDKDGKIKLNDPVNKYMGNLVFKNKIPAQQITVKHLLTHTSGLTNEPLTFRMAYSGEIANNEIDTAFTGTMVYTDTMFNKYNYDNRGYNIYTVLLRQHLNVSWKDVVAKKIFRPLKMNHTTTSLAEAKTKGWNVVVPYLATGFKGAQPTGLPKKDNSLQSAGGIFSSPNDLAVWLEVNINKGKLKGKTVFPKDIIEKCQTGYASVNRTIPPFTGISQYGLGWVIGDYKKEKVIYHFGGFPGYTGHISFMTDKKIGVAIVTNEGTMGSRVAALLASFAYDWWLNTDGMDTVYAKKQKELAEAYEGFKKASEKNTADRAKRPSKLSMPGSAYEGVYKNEFMGEIKVFLKANALHVSIGNMESSSTFFTDDESIRVELTPGSGDVIQFNKNGSNIIYKLVYNNFEFLKMVQ
jgi:CubicO group peptidase (beta-lactamase class C family)